jgi:hypothetical protein
VATSILEQYRISDFIEWDEKKQLKLNPDFQRGAVWTTPARVYLIDTILRRLPIPKIYLRTLVDLETRLSYREVVDGQQRLRAILDFASDKFALSKRAREFEGLRYETLDDELKEAFLTYPIAVDQLLNATDDEVIEVFSRLNSYTVTMNEPEKRHARFQGNFKWSIHERAQRWHELWHQVGVLSTRQRVRMLDDSLMAEMYGVILRGITDGGQPRITALYRDFDDDFPQQVKVERRVDRTLKRIVDDFADVLAGTAIASAPHFLMFFAAVAHALGGIPEGELDEPPVRDEAVLSDISMAQRNLQALDDVLRGDDPPDELEDFWLASQASTQRIASRRVRFPTYFKALGPEAISE